MNETKAPKRNRYGFEDMQVLGYKALEFETRADAIKARSAMHALGSRSGAKFVSELSYNDGEFADLRNLEGKELKNVILNVWRTE